MACAKWNTRVDALELPRFCRLYQVSYAVPKFGIRRFLLIEPALGDWSLFFFQPETCRLGCHVFVQLKKIRVVALCEWIVSDQPEFTPGFSYQPTLEGEILEFHHDARHQTWVFVGVFLSLPSDMPVFQPPFWDFTTCRIKTQLSCELDPIKKSPGSEGVIPFPLDLPVRSKICRMLGKGRVFQRRNLSFGWGKIGRRSLPSFHTKHQPLMCQNYRRTQKIL